MAQSTSRVLEGVFAIEKPPNLSSAQVLRDLQRHFTGSKIFAPLLQQTRERDAEQRQHQKKRKRGQDGDNVFKMGHGGTLDPLATGILIVGIGRGTKHLNDFLGCTKTYETVVLFGKSTDTYDIAGKIVADAPYGHITRPLVEEELANFRGSIKQVPPIYSALKINGMKAYDYARTGKELPRELESRDMVVTECEMVDWFEGGQHEYRWPAEEAAQEDKAAAKKFMKSNLSSAESTLPEAEVPGEQPTAQAKPSPGEQAVVMAKFPKIDDLYSQTAPPQPNPATPETKSPLTGKRALHTHALGPLSASPSPAPAALIRLSVSSGFYVRSFAHDLGLACNSLGIMASLIRSQQAQFTTDPSPSQEEPALLQALPYTDLSLGESIWGPKVQHMLEIWLSDHPGTRQDQPKRPDDRERPSSQWNQKGKGNSNYQNRWQGRGSKSNNYEHSKDRKRRRNSSSPE